MPLYNPVPTGSTSAAGLLQLDGTATDIQSVGPTATAGTSGLAADAKHIHVHPELLIEPSGTLAHNIPVHNMGAANLGALTTGGVVAVSAIGLGAGMSIGHLQVVFGTTAASGPTHFWLALLDSTLTVKAVSTDQGAGAQAASTAIKLAVTIDGSNPYVVATSGVFYVAVSSSASTTAPTLCGITTIAGATGLTPTPCGTAGTQATPPSVGTQLASGTVSATGTANFAAWAMT